MASTSDDQLWFFTRESMSKTDYTQKEHTFKDIRTKGLRLQDCLTIVGIKGSTTNYAFYIFSQSMAAAVRLLNDKSIEATHKLYCTEDPVVTIFIRLANDPSPNTSAAPSHQASLKSRESYAERRGKVVPHLQIRPSIRHVQGSLDVYAGDAIEDEEDMVTIAIDNVDAITFSKEYLVSWIESQLADGKSLTEIVVHSFSPGNVMRDTVLTADLWQTSLIRGPWASSFNQFWDKHNTIILMRTQALKDCLKIDKKFSQMCQDFIRDLRCFGRDKAAQKRLESTGHEFFLGLPYFGSKVVNLIMGVPTFKGTVANDLRQLAIKRAGESICAAHDLAPLYESALNVTWDKERKCSIALHKELEQLSVTATKVSSSPGKGKKALPIKKK